MARNGSGSYSLPSGNPVVTGTTISSTTHNNTMNDIADEITNSVAVDGQSTMTGDLKMGSQTILNVANSTTRTGVPSVGQIQDGGLVAISSISGTNTITGSLSPAITAYASGQAFRFVPANTNTGATTININSVGAGNIFIDGHALTGNELRAGVPAIIFYDGTQFNLLTHTPQIANNVIAEHKNLEITRTSVTVVNITADQLLLEDTNGSIYKAFSVNENIDITVSGIGGLDATDTEAADTWYYLFILYNGTDVNGFMSDSASPTLPSGYTYSAYVGAARNDSSSDLLDIKQTNKRGSYYSRVSDFSGTGSTSGALLTITAPPNTIAVLHNFTSRNNDAKAVLITETFQEDVAASQSVSTTYVSADSEQAQNEVQRRLDSSSQVRVRTDTTGGTTSIDTLGWIFE